MSLDVYLTMPHDGARDSANEGAIFIRDGGETVKISREEWDRRYPGREPAIVEEYPDGEVFWANITHNLNRMAKAAGIYEHLWRPDEIGVTKARQLIAPLTEGVELMKGDPLRFRALNPENNWGSYDGFVPWIEEYIDACREYPDADVSVSR